MSELVKTTLLKTLEQLLEALLPELTIKRDALLPLDIKKICPALIFYEDLEEFKGGNRLARRLLHLDLAVFMAFTGPIYDEDSPAWLTFKDAADVIAGQIHGLWHDPTALAALRAVGLLQVEEGNNRKAPGDPDYGEMVLPVQLTYGHAMGDAFSTQLS